jgi:hypothetical protein
MAKQLLDKTKNRIPIGIQIINRENNYRGVIEREGQASNVASRPIYSK